MSPAPKRRVAVYARISKTTEESVSLERQVESCRDYAAARGWTVAAVFSDDGVSATKVAPWERPAFRELMARLDDFDVVLVWKIDRVARKVRDFLDLDRMIREDRSGAPVYLTAVEDPIDYSTAAGRAIATVLAVFGQLEAEQTSDRAKAARPVILRQGRVIGGRQAWPFETVANPDGPGFVLRPIPERAEAIRDAAQRLADGETSFYAIADEWTARGFATPTGGATWSPVSVRRLFRNRALIGARIVDGEPMRDADGTIWRDPAQAILDPALFSRVIDSERERVRGRSGPREISLPLLHRIAVCDVCGRHLNVQRPKGRAARYYCGSQKCEKPRPAILADDLEALVIERFLAERGDDDVEAWTEEHQDDTELLAEITEALDAVEAALAEDLEDDVALRMLGQRRDLRRRLADAQETTSVRRETVTGFTWADAWDGVVGEDGLDVTAARALLAEAVGAVHVGRVARKTGATVLDRVSIEWREAS